MIERRWERITAGAGLAAAVLCVAGLANWNSLFYTDSISSITNFYVKHQIQVFHGQLFFLLFGFAVLIFAAGLRSILLRSNEGTDTLPTLAFGAALLNAIWMMVWASVNGGFSLVGSQLPANEIRQFIGLESVVDIFTGLSFGLVALAAALAMVEAKTFARWIGWFGVASGVLAAVPVVVILVANPAPNSPIGAIGLLSFLGQILFLIWLIVVGISLLRRSPVAAEGQEVPMRAEQVAV